MSSRSMTELVTKRGGLAHNCQRMSFLTGGGGKLWVLGLALGPSRDFLNQTVGEKGRDRKKKYKGQVLPFASHEQGFRDVQTKGGRDCRQGYSGRRSGSVRLTGNQKGRNRKEKARREVACLGRGPGKH